MGELIAPPYFLSEVDMMEETDMAKRILGKETEKTEEKVVANWLADNVIWKVTKKGGTPVTFNGLMASAVMTEEDKKKARGGVRKFESKAGFTFERK